MSISEVPQDHVLFPTRKGILYMLYLNRDTQCLAEDLLKELLELRFYRDSCGRVEDRDF
jgi:hypothetical protein